MPPILTLKIVFMVAIPGYTGIPQPVSIGKNSQRRNTIVLTGQEIIAKNL